MKLFSWLCTGSNKVTDALNGCSSFFALAARIYVSYMFFVSGWQKLTGFQSAIILFKYEFKVPFLSPEIAAFLSTGLEIGLPILFVLGLGARIPAIIFFIFNVLNVAFYPALLTPEFRCALYDHVLWGVVIAIIMFYGYGKYSLDYLLKQKVCNNYKY